MIWLIYNSSFLIFLAGAGVAVVADWIELEAIEEVAEATEVEFVLIEEAAMTDEEAGDFLNNDEAKDWTFEPNFLTSAPSEAIEKEMRRIAVKYWNFIVCLI